MTLVEKIIALYPELLNVRFVDEIIIQNTNGLYGSQTFYKRGDLLTLGR